MVFAKRTNWPDAVNPLVAQFQKLQDQNIFILDLTVSNPTETFDYPQGVLKALCAEENLRYEAKAFGLKKARQAVCDEYRKQGTDILKENVILTASTSEAYSFLFRLLVEPGEHILLPKPSYPLFEFLANINDVKMDFYPLCYDEKWQINMKSLEASITPKTKILVLVNPNNPTSSFVKENELKAINALCQKHRIAIVCDEVFADYVFERNPSYAKTLAGNNKVLTFVLGGLSKSLSLPQMKLSWMIANGPEEFLRESLRRLEIIADTYLSVNTPSQHALAKWFSLKESIQVNIKNRLFANKKIFFDTFQKNNFCQAYDIEGGWYAILKIKKEIDEEAFALDLLCKQHVFVHPGYFFDFDEEPFLVLSLLTPTDIFQKGVKVLLDQISATG